MEVPKSGGEKIHAVIRVNNPVAIDIRGRSHSFHPSNRMFNQNTNTGDNPVVLFLGIGKGVMSCGFLRHHGIGMVLLQALESRIGPYRNRRGNHAGKIQFVRQSFIVASSRFGRRQFAASLRVLGFLYRTFGTIQEYILGGRKLVKELLHGRDLSFWQYQVFP